MNGKKRSQLGNMSVVGDPYAMPREVQAVVDRLSDRDWHSLAVQLGRYALQKSRRFSWRTGHAGDLPDGEATESIVSKALLLWMTGRRRWNRGEYDGLQDFLEGVIDSLLSHAARGQDNRGVSSHDVLLAVVRGTPETELLERERATEAGRTLAGIEEEARGDEIVLEILGAMRHGAATRRAIVAGTQRSANEIDNGLKRLRRLAESVAQRSAQGRDHGLHKTR